MKSIIVGLGLYFIAVSPSAAWHEFGHMEVAAVAWEKLTPTVRARVGRLLEKNPLHGTWIAGVDPADRDRVAFIKSSVWADTIKKLHEYRNDGSHNGDRPPPGPEASRNIGYVDHLRHKYWHFIDLPFTPDDTSLEDEDTPNAQTQIAKFRATLAHPGGSDDVKSYDLVWLTHLVGDVHQPLHATSRFTQTQTDGDAGGNHVKIECGCEARELHGFWDGVVGEGDDVARATAAARALPEPDTALAAVGNEMVWIRESFQLAKDKVYAGPVGIGAGPFTLDNAYMSEAKRIANERVALAGARLANLINHALR